MLTDTQVETLELLEDYIESDKNMFFLFGYAGTGKTYLVSKFVDIQMNSDKINKIFVCAPTHKALNVIESYMKNNVEDIDLKKVKFMTIHKMLGFKAQIDTSKGEKNFVTNTESKFLKQTKKINILIVDECSMISESISNHIEENLKKRNKLKILFIGDSAQLPPVGEKISRTFEISKSEKKYIVQLDEIVRTKSPDIQKISKLIRKWNGNKFNDLMEKIIKIHNTKSKSFSLFHKKIKNGEIEPKWFSNFKKNIENNHTPIILTWKNNTSDYYNNLIRSKLHRNDSNNFTKGDLAMFNNFYKSLSNRNVFYTSDVVVVKKIYYSSLNDIDWNDLKKNVKKTSPKQNVRYFNTLLKKLDLMDYEIDINIMTVKKFEHDSDSIIKTVDIESKNKYLTLIEDIKKNIEHFYNKTNDDELSELLWKFYYENLVDNFAEINFGYSITIHKSQGSTFDTVYVDLMDILDNQNTDEMIKSLYTAVTRAAIKLCFLV